MTVAELIAELAKQDQSQPVICTWEGIFREPSVYVAKNSTVIIDADDDHYREDIESGRMAPTR